LQLSLIRYTLRSSCSSSLSRWTIAERPRDALVSATQLSSLVRIKQTNRLSAFVNSHSLSVMDGQQLLTVLLI